MQSAGGENGGGDVNARIEKVMSSRLVSGSAENMPMSRSEQRAYQRIGEELMEAVRGGNANIVKQLCLEKQADPSFADDFGFSCLHLAAKRGYQDVVQVLVDMGADINQEGEGGTIPLHMAAQCGNLLLVQYMVGLGADVDLKDASGSTPLRLAQTYGHRKVEDYLRERVDTGSGRWAKEDEENREQTIYDDSTFPWDSFLKENKDKIVVDMEEEDEYGQDEGEIPQELRDAMKRVENQASYMQPPGSGGVIDVSGEQVSARTIENRESNLRANQPPPTVDMSDELKREMDGLLGVSGLAEPTRPAKADDKAGRPSPSGEERSNMGGAESNTELDEAEEEMILQSAVETLLRELPGAQRVDMSQADRFQAAIKNEAAKKRKASEQGREKESERDDPMKKACHAHTYIHTFYTNISRPQHGFFLYLYIYIYIYMYMYIYIYIYIYIFICIYIYIYIYIYVCIYIYICIYIYVCIYVYIHIHLCIYTYMDCMCVCVRVCIHTYIRMIHTYIHMRKSRHSNNALCAAGLFEDKATELTYRADACIISAGADTRETNN
jgi:hypothetical protein